VVAEQLQVAKYCPQEVVIEPSQPGGPGDPHSTERLGLLRHADMPFVVQLLAPNVVMQLVPMMQEGAQAGGTPLVRKASVPAATTEARFRN